MITLEKYLRHTWWMVVVWVIFGPYVLPHGERSLMVSYAVLGILVALMLIWILINTVLEERFSVSYATIEVKAEVRNLPSRSSLHEFGLRNGDIVTALDGEPLRSVADLHNWWREKEFINLVVLRDGKVIPITVHKK